ncbi:MAG: hypothetical protein IJC68_00195, partial [Firmicutes bacterium]|nr:hypothetical protein [Bacillota bacterium]
MEENKQFPLPQEEPLLSDAVPVEAEQAVLPDITELPMQPLPDLPEESLPSAEDAAPVEASVSGEDTLPQPLPDKEVSAEEAPLPEELPSAEENSTTEEVFPSSVETLMDEAVPLPAEQIGDVEADVVPSEDIPTENPVAEEVPLRTGEEFMTRIPDVESDYPEPDPELTKTIEDIEALLDKPVDQDYRDAEPDPEFDAMLTAPAPEEEKIEHERPTRKGRPKRRRGEGLLGIPNILATFVWLALIVVIGVTAGRMLWVCA